MGEEVERNPLWLILVNTANSLPLYKYHKSYVRDRILIEDASISPEELSQRLDIDLGEAIVILYEIDKEKNAEN
jgi:hypothetical protein